MIDHKMIDSSMTETLYKVVNQTMMPIVIPKTLSLMQKGQKYGSHGEQRLQSIVEVAHMVAKGLGQRCIKQRRIDIWGCRIDHGNSRVSSLKLAESWRRACWYHGHHRHLDYPRCSSMLVPCLFAIPSYHSIYSGQPLKYKSLSDSVKSLLQWQPVTHLNPQVWGFVFHTKRQWHCSRPQEAVAIWIQASPILSHYSSPPNPDILCILIRILINVLKTIRSHPSPPSQHNPPRVIRTTMSKMWFRSQVPMSMQGLHRRSESTKERQTRKY